MYYRGIFNMEGTIKTKVENYTLRFAEEKDIPLILKFIKELADYEKLLKLN